MPRKDEAGQRVIEAGRTKNRATTYLMARGGKVPRATWQNLPTDLEHFLSCFAAHEDHHRGQTCLVVRQLGQRPPKQVADGVWHWR